MNDLFTGMILLLGYKVDAQMHAEHDQIWLGPGAIKVSEEDEKVLWRLHWFIDEDADYSWSHFC